MEKYLVRLGDVTREVEVVEDGEGLLARIDDRCLRISLESVGPTGHFWLQVEDRAYELIAERQNHSFHLLIGPRLYALTLEREGTSRRNSNGSHHRPGHEANGAVVSPMMGAVVKVMVQPGQRVEVGDVLLIIESMKMHNEIRAQHAGTVQAVHVQPGQRVTPTTNLLELS